MRRGLNLILALVVMCTAGISAAEGQKAPDFILEGYEGESTGNEWDTNLFFERMEEKTGISFEFREYTQYSVWEGRKRALAEGTDLPDVLFKAALTDEETRKLAASGVLIDLKPYLAEYAPDLWKLLQEDPDALAAVSMKDGTIPALPAFQPLQNNDVMWINSSWLQRLRLETPTDAESLKEVLRAFRDQDPNNNGQKDEIPLTFIGMWELRFLGHAFGITDNDYYLSAQDGKAVSALTSDNNRAFLTWLHELWEENLLDHNGFSNADSIRRITDDKKTIPYGLILSCTPLTVIPSASLENYSLLMPMTFEGKQVYRDLAGDMIRGTFAVTSRCAAPEKLVSWVNTLYTTEGALMAQYGLEGVEYSIREDGLWEWNEDLQTVTEVVLPKSTIGSGAAVPGISPVDFQLHYSDDATRTDIEQLMELKQYTVTPFPQVTLSREDEAEAARIQQDLSAYAETAMARFVTGDVELNDEQWEIFCGKVNELGLQKMTDLWGKYLK